MERDAAADCVAGTCPSDESAGDEPTVATPTAGDTGDDTAPRFAACNPMSSWLKDGRAVPARVEAHHGTSDGLEVVIIGPEPSEPNAARVFVGRLEHLTEVTALSVEEADPRDDVLGPARWLFEAPYDVDRVGRFDIYGIYPQFQEWDAGNSGSVFVEGNEEYLEQQSRTRLALGGYVFECARPDALGWQLSNDPPTHNPPTACVPGPVPEFHCFSFPASVIEEFDFEANEGHQELSATVLELGSGTPPGELCRREIEDGLLFRSEMPLAWARIEVGGGEGMLVLRSPGIPLPFSVGADLDISRTFTLDSEHLTVRDPAGQLLLWTAQSANGLDGVDPPAGISLTRGVEQCGTLSQGCYQTSQFGISFGMRDQIEHVAYGMTGTLDGYTFVHAGYDVGTAMYSGCYDGAPSGVAAQIWGRPVP